MDTISPMAKKTIKKMENYSKDGGYVSKEECNNTNYYCNIIIISIIKH